MDFTSDEIKLMRAHKVPETVANHRIKYQGWERHRAMTQELGKSSKNNRPKRKTTGFQLKA